MTEHVYNKDFYAYIGEGSRRSARIIIPLLREDSAIASVLDMGAGNGSWIAAWMENGVEDALAVDGAYVDRASLVIPAGQFHAHDLCEPLDLGRRFDIVQSLEVAEHLPEDRADTFVDSLVRHGDIVLFSAAVPNQGGEFHVNEQPPEYWRRKFAARGYACFDALRPRLAEQADVKPWYRFNTLLYANAAGRARLGERILASEVPDHAALAMAGDAAWKARQAAVSLLPQRGVHWIAQLKASLEARRASR